MRVEQSTRIKIHIGDGVETCGDLLCEPFNAIIQIQGREQTARGSSNYQIINLSLQSQQDEIQKEPS